MSKKLLKKGSKLFRHAMVDAGSSANRFVKQGKYAWQVYKIYSSHVAAVNGIKSLQKAFGKDRLAQLRAIKTKQGWGVFQLSKHPYRTLAKSKDLIPVD